MTPDGLLCHSSPWMLSKVTSLSISEMISGCGFPDISLTSFLKSHIRVLDEVLAKYPLLGPPCSLAPDVLPPGVPWV